MEIRAGGQGLRESAARSGGRRAQMRRVRAPGWRIEGPWRPPRSSPRRYGGLIGPTSGSMGYGFPAALGMKTLYPERPVVCVAGDGDFLMTGQDFATCVQYERPVIIIIADNGSYGTIRMHQEREYPGRVIATALRNPDFVAYAKAFGGFGALVEKTADFPAAFAAAQKSGLPSIIHCKVDPEAITPALTLSGIREKALGGAGGPHGTHRS